MAAQPRRAVGELDRFCEMLRDLQRASGQPSLAALRKSMSSTPGISTLSDLLTGKIKRPPRWELVSELITACKDHAARAGRDLPPSMADLARWRARHDEVVRIVDAVQRAERRPRIAPTARLSFCARPITEWNPLDLGVHRAIDVSGGAGSSEARLTSYILRPHDRELSGLLSGQEFPASIFVLGDSSTGKTRSCVEAVRGRLPEMPIAYPVDSAELCDILDRVAEVGSLILWLDEAQRYLDGEGASGVAARLTRIMQRNSDPVLVIGTMWPDRWLDLTSPPDRGQPDHSAGVRQYLSLSRVKRVLVPGNFSDTSDGELGAVARKDRRLNVALMSAGAEHNLTQVLAGGVQLVERYQVTLDVHSRSLLTAAMDCSRLGYGSPMGRELLTSSMAGYLSAAERVMAPEELTMALEQATFKVHGISALEPVRLRPGLGEADAYRLHDYLHHFGRKERETAPVPRSTWEALDKYAGDFSDRVRLSWQAAFRHYYRLASRFLEEVVEAEHAAQDCLRLVWILERAGHRGRAEAILERAAQAGDLSSMRELAARSFRAGDYGATIHWLRTAAGLKDA
jgi:hypothetical protein